MRLFVGREGGDAVGIAEVTLGDDGVAGIYNVVTLPHARGRGVGTALVRHVLAEAGRTGCHRVELQAAVAGVGIYRRLGFRPFGSWAEYRLTR